MAQAPRLDFEGYVAKRKGERFGRRRRDHRARVHLHVRPPVARRLREHRPVALAVEASVRLFKTVGTHQLLGNAVKVSERQFPRIYGIVRRRATRCRSACPRSSWSTARSSTRAPSGTNDDSFIMVHSSLVDQYTDEELLTVIGHECGHIHNSHVAYLTALHYLSYMAGMFLPWILQPAMVALRDWSSRAEITCDRAGMLVAKDQAGVRARHHQARRRLARSSTRSSTSTRSSSSTTRAARASAIHGGLRDPPVAAQARAGHARVRREPAVPQGHRRRGRAACR